MPKESSLDRINTLFGSTTKALVSIREYQDLLRVAEKEQASIDYLAKVEEQAIEQGKSIIDIFASRVRVIIQHRRDATPSQITEQLEDLAGALSLAGDKYKITITVEEIK